MVLESIPEKDSEGKYERALRATEVIRGRGDTPSTPRTRRSMAEEAWGRDEVHPKSREVAERSGMGG